MDRKRPSIVLISVVALSASFAVAGEAAPRFGLFDLLTSPSPPLLISYNSSALDPRSAVNHRLLPTSSIRADLEALRPIFDGLVLYGYDQASTPRIVALASELHFRAILLGVWDPRSADEIDGVAKLVQLFGDKITFGVIVGNEGLTTSRYEKEDLLIAEARLRRLIPMSVPIATSEPLAGYAAEFLCSFGDFHAPNIHPVFDRKELSAKDAATWAREKAVALAEHTHHPVILKETGFPHGGNDRYTEVTQAAFWSSYCSQPLLVRLAEEPQHWAFLGAAFEAFDLPFKSRESGLAIEQSWGLFANDRKPYPALDAWREVQKRIPSTTGVPVSKE